MTTNNVSNNWKKRLPDLTVRLIASGEINLTSKEGATLTRADRLSEFQHLMLRDFGLQTAVTPDSIRIIKPMVSSQPAFESKVHYKTLLFLLARLAMLNVGKALPRQSLVDEMLGQLKHHEGANNDRIVISVLNFAKNHRLIELAELEVDGQGSKQSVVIKKRDLQVIDQVFEQPIKDKTTKVLNHLIKHQTMNIQDFPELWVNPDVRLNKLLTRLEPYQGEESGYKIIMDGHSVRLINYTTSKNLQVPGATRLHDLAFDVAHHYGDDQKLTDAIAKSTRALAKPPAELLDSVKDIIETYKLDQLNIATV